MIWGTNKKGLNIDLKNYILNKEEKLDQLKINFENDFCYLIIFLFH